MLKPARRRELAQKSVADGRANIRQACQAYGVSETCYRYQTKLNDENAEIADWLVRLTTDDADWGFGLCFDYLRNVEGFSWNHKRVYRIYYELQLNLRIKPKRRLNRHKPEPLKEPLKPNQVWSMDFMHDQLSDGRKFRLFNVTDDFKREGLAIEAGFSLPALRVIRVLSQLLEWRKNLLLFVVITALNLSATILLAGVKNEISELNIFSQAIHNKIHTLSERTEPSATVG